MGRTRRLVSPARGDGRNPAWPIEVEVRIAVSALANTGM